MRHELKAYKTLIFDCDGVVLDSNTVKTKAFYLSALHYGKEAASALVEYHVTNGGVSRYKKFAYFLEHIAQIQSTYEKVALDSLLKIFAIHVREGLLNCKVAPGLEALRQQTGQARWLIVSGGDQAELRDVFAERGIAEWFDGGIFGSPDTKEEILAREMFCNKNQAPALFLGDSKYDYLAANKAGLDFLFLTGLTEVKDWQEFCQNNDIANVATVKELL